MKKIILVTFVALLFITPVSVFAQANSSPKQKVVTVGKEQVIAQDYFTAGDRVVIDGTVNGDAYIAGGQVDVNGTINGDLLVAGGQVTVRGSVLQNIRAVGGTILIEGTVGRNVSIVGGSLTLDKSAKINGNAALVGGTISILTPVKMLNIAGGDVSLESTVSGNVMGAVGNLQVFPDAQVKGNLTYWSDKEAEIAQGASVSGTVNFNQTDFKNKLDNSQEKAQKAANGFGMFMRLVSFASALIVGLLLIRFVPVFSSKTADLVSTNFWKTMSSGFVVVVATPVLIVLLLVTLIGVPFAFFVGIAYMSAIYFSKFFVAMALGKYLSQSWKSNLSDSWQFVVGIAMFSLLSMLPVIGFFVKLVFLFAGVGALFLTKKEYFTSLRTKKII